MAITRGDWTQWTFTLPAAINPLGLQRIGVQFEYSDIAAPFTGNVYIDNVYVSTGAGHHQHDGAARDHDDGPAPIASGA